MINLFALKQDPLKIIRKTTIKCAILIFSFISIGIILHLNLNLFILTFLYLAYICIISVLGDDYNTKILSILLFSIGALIIFEISPYAYPIFIKHPFYLLPFVFLCFWTRKFGELLFFAPMFLLISICVSFIRLPLEKTNSLSFLTIGIIITFISCIFLLNHQKYKKKKEIIKIQDNILKENIKYYREILENIKIIENIEERNDIIFNKIYISILSTDKQLSSVINNQINKKKWNIYYHNLILLNRLVIKLTKKYIYLNKLSRNKNHIFLLDSLDTLFFEIMRLHTVLFHKKNNVWRNKIEYIEYIKEIFENKYYEKYQTLGIDKNFIISIILLLDDILVVFESLRED